MLLHMDQLPSKHDIQESIQLSLRPAWRIDIVYSSWYTEEIGTMVDGAIKTLKSFGVKQDNISTHPVSGSFEIPLIGAALAKRSAVHALIGLGIIVEGETHHARIIAEQTARGIMDVQLQYLIPFVNEVLYVDTLALAQKRLSKGEEAAICALYSLAQLTDIRS